MPTWLIFSGLMLGYIVMGVLTFVLHEHIWLKETCRETLRADEFDNACMLSCMWPGVALFWIAVSICLAVYLPISWLVGFLYSSIGKIKDYHYIRVQHKRKTKELIAKHGYIPVELPKDIEEILYKDLK